MCNFCVSLAADKELMMDKICYEFTVAKVKKTWTKEKGKRNASQTTEGMYFLNYCPECGRKINLRERSKQFPAN